MNKPTLVKLIFVDGPLEGQTRVVCEDEIKNTRTYRVFIPSPGSDIQKNYDMKPDEYRVICRQVEYIPFNIPSSYGMARFIMCQQNAGLGN